MHLIIIIELHMNINRGVKYRASVCGLSEVLKIKSKAEAQEGDQAIL